ncbi:MAG TPA: sugar ABC transporter ATP-binding protein [Solirubrobacteraceae bacterium]|nr:sugar ABC transporter ATP-binding protein [Solirubrobacteraceae bacterium]
MGEPEGGLALAVRDVVKRYGATIALSGVTFEIAQGSAHALIGENGAGKSTLVKIVSGITRPDSGEIELFGTRMRRIAAPAKAAALGIGTAFQELSLVPTLTVADNLLLGIEPHSPRELRHQAQTLLDACDIPDVSPDWRVEDLTLPERQMVEIAKATRHEPRLLFLDESTSALGEGAADWFRNLLSKLRDRNTTLVFITHRLGEVREHCDHATVLRNGEAVGDVAIDEADEDEVVKMMIGRSMDQAFPDRRPAKDRAVKLRTKGLAHQGAFHDVDLELHEGEILGVAGLDGQGQRELFLSLFGVLPSDDGEILIDDQPVQIRSPRDAIDSHLGISLVPEDRKTEGLFLALSTATNMAIPSLGHLASHGWINERRVRKRATETAERLNLDPAVVPGEVGHLSGGNQQKVVIGKWVLAGARFLLLYDPTRGVDVATKFEIYKLIQALAEEGCSMLVYSSDLTEVVGLCDRVLTFYRSHVTGEFQGDELTETNVLGAIVGHHQEAAA